MTKNKKMLTITKRQTFRAYFNCVPRILSFGPGNEREDLLRENLTVKYVTGRRGIGPLPHPKNKNEARDRSVAGMRNIHACDTSIFIPATEDKKRCK